MLRMTKNMHGLKEFGNSQATWRYHERSELYIRLEL